MAGFSSYDDLISEITAGKIFDFSFSKVGGATPAAGSWYSLARVAGTPPAVTDGAAGSGTPGAGGTALSSATGHITLPDKSPDIKAIVTFGAISTVACNLMIYDRLNHTSGVVVNTTGTKNVGSPALTRYSGTASVGNQVWLEYTTAGTTTANIINLLSYTDDAGNTGQVGGSITGIAAQILGSMLGPMPLATGDLGVRSVETINVGTASTAGVVQVVILRPLAVISLPANTWVEKDMVLQLTALPLVNDGASLNLMYQCTTTTAANVWGTVRIAWG